MSDSSFALAHRCVRFGVAATAGITWGASFPFEYRRASVCSLQEQLVFPPSPYPFHFASWENPLICLNYLILNISWHLYDWVSCIFLSYTGLYTREKKVTIWNFSCDGNSRFFSHIACLGLSFWPGPHGNHFNSGSWTCCSAVKSVCESSCILTTS